MIYYTSPFPSPYLARLIIIFEFGWSEQIHIINLHVHFHCMWSATGNQIRVYNSPSYLLFISIQPTSKCYVFYLLAILRLLSILPKFLFPLGHGSSLPIYTLNFNFLIRLLSHLTLFVPLRI